MEEKYFTILMLYHDGITSYQHTVTLKYDHLVLLPGGFLGLTQVGFRLLEESTVPKNWYSRVPNAKIGALLHPRPGLCITVSSNWQMSVKDITTDQSTVFILHAGQVWIPYKTPTEFSSWENSGIPGRMPSETFKALQLSSSLVVHF